MNTERNHHYSLGTIRYTIFISCRRLNVIIYYTLLLFATTMYYNIT